MVKKLIASVISIILLLAAAAPLTQAQEYRRRKPSKTRTGLKIGAGAAVGAGIGALVGGGKGAAAGALIGGGALAAQSVAKRNSGYGRRTRTIGTIAAGTAIGTGVGAAIGGGKGAGIGALLGGGGSTVYALTRKDLKEPRYEARRVSRQQGASNAVYQQDPRAVESDDPYRRLSGPQGACVGHLLCDGSTVIYEQNQYR
ncbi:MAG: hypothetical protein AB1489_01080 [Acidobacteriota bacterium]